MDHYVEQLVAKQKGGREWGIIGGTIAVAAALAFLCFWFLGPVFLIVLVGLVYGVYWIVSAQETEFEYCVTNGDMDIDSIVAKRKRKRIVSVRGGKIESLEPLSGSIPSGFDRTVMAASSPTAAGCWRFTYHSKKNGHTQVIFEPNDAVLDELIGGLSRPLQLEVRKWRG